MTAPAADPALIDSYREWTADALAEFGRLLDDWRAGTLPADAARQRMFEIGHNIKGMGASFGYPLMSDAGGLLCSFLKLKPGDPQERAVLAALHEGLRAILALTPEQQTPAMAARLVAPLRLLCDLPDIAI